jgi:Na+-driven multidrug efflux pump
MGIEGAALASVMAEFVAMITYLLFTFRKNIRIQYQLFRFRRFSRELFFRIVRIAGPLMAQYSISFGVWFLFFLMVENLGERQLAISNIIRSVYMVMMLPLMGFSMATNTLVSYVIGLGKSEEVMTVIRKTLLICLAGIGVIIALSYIDPSVIIRIYTDDLSLVQDSLASFRVVSVAVFFLAAGLVVFNGVSGTGKTQVSFRIELIVLVLYMGLVFCLTRNPGIPVAVVWMSEIIYGLLLATLSFVYLRSGRWKGARV